MKKSEITATLLIASLIFPATGCNNAQKQEVITLAEEYADAVIEEDAKAIADTMDEDEEEIDLSHFVRNDREAIADIISDSISYELDTDSIQIVGDRAYIDITYTLVDYVQVYEDQDDDADLEGYIEELENSDYTTTVVQTIEMVEDHGEWRIDGSGYENSMELYSYYDIIDNFFWGGPEGSAFESFAFAVQSAFSINRNDLYMEEHDDYYYVSYFDGLNDCTYYEFEDENDALDKFVELVGNYGYYMSDGDTFFVNNEDGCYGGIYIRGNVVYYIVSLVDDSATIELVNDILTRMDLPTPC